MGIFDFLTGGSQDAPSAPDPNAVAKAQTGANINTAVSSSFLNNMNRVTPYGSTSYDTTGYYTTPDGQVVPRFTETTALSPLGQTILSGQQTAVSNLMPAADSVSKQAGAAATTPLDFNTAQSGILNSTPQFLSDRAADALYGKQKGFLDPQWTQQQRQLEDQLSRQGIPVGSEAYNNAMTQFDTAKTQAYDAAQNGAIAGGTTAAGNLFNMALAGHQQNLSDQRLAKTDPFTTLQSIFGQSSQNPQQPIMQPSNVPIAPTDVIGATNGANSMAMNLYNTNSANSRSTWGDLARLGSAWWLS